MAPLACLPAPSTWSLCIETSIFCSWDQRLPPVEVPCAAAELMFRHDMLAPSVLSSPRMCLLAGRRSPRLEVRQREDKMADGDRYGLKQFSGILMYPDHAGYDEARLVFNGMID